MFNLLNQLEDIPATTKLVPDLESKRQVIRTDDDGFLNQSSDRLLALAEEIQQVIKDANNNTTPSGEIAPDPVVESAPDTNTVVDDETVVEAPQEVQGLKILAEEKGQSKDYTLRNLIADFFTQKANRKGDTTLRPLVTVESFLDKFTFNNVAKFLKDGTVLSENQKSYLQFFKNINLRKTDEIQPWQDIITRNLTKKGKEIYQYQDLMKFLITETATIPDVEQNVKTAIAYAAFNWIIDAAFKA